MSQLEFVCLVMDEVLNGLAVSCDRILRVWSDMNEVRRAWAGSEAGGVGGPLVLARRLAVRAPGGGGGGGCAHKRRTGEEMERVNMRGAGDGRMAWFGQGAVLVKHLQHKVFDTNGRLLKVRARAPRTAREPWTVSRVGGWLRGRTARPTLRSLGPVPVSLSLPLFLPPLPLSLPPSLLASLPAFLPLFPTLALFLSRSPPPPPPFLLPRRAGHGLL